MLSATAEYALRAMTYLACVPRDRIVLGRDLSREADVPPAYLTKVLLALRNAGLVDTVRGTGGGYRLRKPPDQIYLMDIVELFDGRKTQSTCLLGHSKECSEHQPCSAHRVWRELRAAYFGLLISTSLAAMAGLPPQPLVEPRRLEGGTQ